MMKNKTINIGNEYFTLHTRTTVDASKLGNYSNSTADIYKFYEKPSKAKVSIWNEWVEWAKENNAEISIASGNHHTFTIQGKVTVDNVLYYVYITKTANHLYKVA